MTPDEVDALATRTGTARVLRTLGVHPRKRWGQHFLVDAHALGQILSAQTCRWMTPCWKLAPGWGR